MKAGLSRRQILDGGFAAAVVAVLPQVPVAAGQNSVDPLLGINQTPAGNLATYAKLIADLDGSTLISITRGLVYGILPQADDLALDEFGRVLYGYQTVNARKVKRRDDRSITIRTQSWVYYSDPGDGGLLEAMHNPYTGETVQPPALSNEARDQVFTINGPDFSNAPFPVESTEADRPFALDYAVIGADAFITRRSFTRFPTPGTDWHKLEADMVSHTCKVRDLIDPALTHIPNTWAHNLVAEWQTWMNMHGSPGRIIFKGNGAAVRSVDELPTDIRDILDRRFPGTLASVAFWDAA